jgi:GNAT superfamily N-acetyltransferase
MEINLKAEGVKIVFYEFKNKAIQSACKKAVKVIDWNRISLKYSNEIDITAWWNKDPAHNYCVDIHSGNIVLEHLDEDGKNGITENIGEFSCCYFYRYDPQGNHLDVLNNADAISGDLCLAVETIMNSKKWEDVYDFASGVLYIDRFYIKPDYRGKKFGYLIFPVLVDVFSKRTDSIVTIIPEPLNDMVKDLGKEESTLKDTPEYQLALTKMQDFIKHFGFEQLGDGQVWGSAVMDRGMFS